MSNIAYYSFIFDCYVPDRSMKKECIPTRITKLVRRERERERESWQSMGFK